MTEPVIRNAGESALIIEFGDKIDMRVNNAALAFDARLRNENINAISETAPTIRSVMVCFDPLALAPDDLRARLREMLAEQDWRDAPPPEDRRLWRIPAVYGGEAGPDLPGIAEMIGAEERDLIEEHAATRQRALMLGFMPGLAYLGVLPERWDIPRLEQITPEIPPGAIAVAVRQSILTTTPMPTGWRVIARTAFRSFDPTRDPPFLIRPGDEVEFEPVSSMDFDDPPSLAPEPLS